MSANPALTVVMPALNEAENIALAIGNTLQAFDDYAIAGEIVVINDGSTDRTPDVVADIQTRDTRVRIIHHKTPEGIGAAFWEGVQAARGEFLCMLPGDNENDPWELFRYVPIMQHVDILVPFVFNKQVRSLFRNALSFAYRFIINTTFMVNFNYTNGTVIYRSHILKDIPFCSSGFFFQTDILIRLVKQGYLFAEVPYRLNMRADGVSKAVSFPSLINVIKGYLRLVRDIHFKAPISPAGTFDPDSQTAKRHEPLPHRAYIK